MKKGEVKKAVNGEKYKLIKRIGRGGQAEVWKVQQLKDKKYYAYKHYKHNKYNIRSNIEDLINIGEFKDKNGISLSNIVILPQVMVEGEGDSFGYIMELVDLEDYTVIKQAWFQREKLYPSYKAICKIVQNFARFFETIHNTYGLCYKDVNEGNIFFNPVTGDIKIIDNDNIGYADKFTIKGTSGYMAPEVILGAKPDHNSDKFSFAVFVYRLLIAGYPFEGPFTESYCLKNDILKEDARKVIFGTEATFVWHPTDHKNSIENSKDPKLQGQAAVWKGLPDSIKDMFISTFATNLAEDRRAERTTDTDWREKFEELEKKLVTCPSCGKLTFHESPKCMLCDAALPLSQVRKHSATLRVLSAGEAKRDMTVHVSDTATGPSISKNLPSGNLFKILYNKKLRKMGMKNMSTAPWTIVHADSSKEKCAPGQVVILEKDMKVRIIPKTAQLNILDVV